VAFTTEATKVGVWHHHLVLDCPERCIGGDGPPAFDAEVAEAKWKQVSPRAGFSKMTKYIKGGGAAAYVVKTGDWDAGTVCPRDRPCRRAGGCHVGTSPWS
jgi:hypothetical protein